MSKQTDRLEHAAAEFNHHVNKIVKYTKKELAKEDPPSAEGYAALDTLRSLDCVVEELVRAVLDINAKTKKSKKK